jgi:catechol 2,3-dioxygenase-like lactoylglutathione lyase family enzyme
MTPRFDLIGLVVQDLDRSLAFYRDLGLDVPAEAAGPHVEAALPGGLRLAFDHVEVIRSFDPAWAAPTGSARTSLAFACDDPADVDATYERMTAAGHTGHKPPWDAAWGMRYALLEDPDGNGVDLFAPLS